MMHGRPVRATALGLLLAAGAACSSPELAVPAPPATVARPPEPVAVVPVVAASDSMLDVTGLVDAIPGGLVLGGPATIDADLAHTLLTLDAPVMRVGVFGDSMFASVTGHSDLFDLVSDGLVAMDVGVVDARNLAVPGQGIVIGLEITEPDWHVLDRYLRAIPDDRLDLDLALIALGRVDLNRLPDTVSVADLALLTAARLDQAIGILESHGTQVAVLPAFGTHDPLFDALLCKARRRCEPQELDAKAVELNARLVDLGVPMLFDRYVGTDLDDVPGTDIGWFTGFDPEGRWPDDGQHPNLAGEQLMAGQILAHLSAAFDVSGARGTVTTRPSG